VKLFVVGINYNTAPVEIREKLSFAKSDIVNANRCLKERVRLEEGLILSTCNRVEIYAVADSRQRDHVSQIKSFLGEYHNIRPSDLENRFYMFKGEETVRHLFKVASGLDSMVIGEMEILGQVKDAYQDAVDSKTSGKVLNRLLQKTFSTAKKIRTDTFISRGAVSVSSVAVKLAEKILGDLSDKKVFVIGAGKVAEQLMVYLKKDGIRFISVANRTFEKASALADKFWAAAVKFDALREHLIDADIVITSTGAPHLIIHKQDIAYLMPKRKQKPLFIIDLAVPRDVDAQAGMIDNVYLYDIDDLKKIVDNNLALRHSELDNCQKIIAESSRRFTDWLISEKIQDEE